MHSVVKKFGNWDKVSSSVYKATISVHFVNIDIMDNIYKR